MRDVARRVRCGRAFSGGSLGLTEQRGRRPVEVTALQCHCNALPHRGNYCACARVFAGMGPSCQRLKNLPHLMRWMQDRHGESTRHSDIKERCGGVRLAYLPLPLPPPLPLHPLHSSSEPRGERKEKKPTHLSRCSGHLPHPRSVNPMA